MTVGMSTVPLIQSIAAAKEPVGGHLPEAGAKEQEVAGTGVQEAVVEQQNSAVKERSWQKGRSQPTSCTECAGEVDRNICR